MDALDECSSRTELLDVIDRIVAWNHQNVHVLLTSRKEVDIDERMHEFVPDVNQISLQSHLVDKDIQKYINKRLDSDRSLKRWKNDAPTQELIKTTLTNKANGMFRWCAYQLDDIGRCLTRAMVAKTLNNLPKDLDETYARILCGIDDTYRPYARSILRWLVFTPVPLTTRYLCEIMGIDLEAGVFEEDNVFIDPQDLARVCPGLITAASSKPNWSFEINDRWESATVIQLAHFSIEEYLLSNRIQQGDAAYFSLRNEESHEILATSYLVRSMSAPTNPFVDIKLTPFDQSLTLA